MKVRFFLRLFKAEKYAWIAQLVEQLIEAQCVVRSNRTLSNQSNHTTLHKKKCCYLTLKFLGVP